MNILIAVHGFPPTHSAGAERRAERMARWLHAHNHHVEVFTAEKVDAPEFRMISEQQDGFTVHRLYYDIRAGVYPFRNGYDNRLIGAALENLLQQRQFDVIHLISGYLLGAPVIHTARTANIPIVVTLTEFWFMCPQLNLIMPNGKLCSGPESVEKCARCVAQDKRRYRLPEMFTPSLMDVFWQTMQNQPFAQGRVGEIERRQRILTEALSLADLVICPSRFLMDTFENYGFDVSRFIHLRQGLEVPKTAPPTPAMRQDKRLRLTYMGQIKPHKGVDLLIQAVMTLLDEKRPVTLDLWGSEDHEKQYSTQLKELSAGYPAIRWRGKFTGAKVWDVLEETDALVIPSRWYENSPNTILEASYMNVPVVATNLGGMSELVKHRHNGLLFELNDAPDLTQQLRSLLDEPNLMLTLRANIKPIRTIDQEMRMLVNHYSELVPAREQGADH